MQRAFWGCAAMLACAGCSSDDSRSGITTAGATAASCIAEHGPANGGDWESFGTIPTSPPGDAAAPPPPVALDEAVAKCTEDIGASDPAACDREKVITHQAALCIAELAQLG